MSKIRCQICGKLYEPYSPLLLMSAGKGYDPSNTCYECLSQIDEILSEGEYEKDMREEEAQAGLTQRLRDAIDEAGLTLTEFADRAGISRQIISGYVNHGRSMRTKNLARICETLDVSADWLLFGKEKKDGYIG